MWSERVSERRAASPGTGLRAANRPRQLQDRDTRLRLPHTRRIALGHRSLRASHTPRPRRADAAALREALTLGLPEADGGAAQAPLDGFASHVKDHQRRPGSLRSAADG